MNCNVRLPLSERPTIRTAISIPLDVAGKVIAAQFVTFSDIRDSAEHFAVIFPQQSSSLPLVRVHSECITGDAFGSLRCDCGRQLQESIERIAACGGCIVYLRQEGRGIGLFAKLEAYRLQQDLGLDTYAANVALGFNPDSRDYSAAADILRALEMTRVRLLTNNPEKAAKLRELGILVEQVVPTGVFANPFNHAYLTAKTKLTGHQIDLKEVCRDHIPLEP